jgi:hypothetical protein
MKNNEKLPPTGVAPSEDVYLAEFHVLAMFTAAKEEGDPLKNTSLKEILEEMDDGEFIGTVERISMKRILPSRVRAVLRQLGNDGTFFDTEVPKDLLAQAEGSLLSLFEARQRAARVLYGVGNIISTAGGGVALMDVFLKDALASFGGEEFIAEVSAYARDAAEALRTLGIDARGAEACDPLMEGTTAGGMAKADLGAAMIGVRQQVVREVREEVVGKKKLQDDRDDSTEDTLAAYGEILGLLGQNFQEVRDNLLTVQTSDAKALANAVLSLQLISPLGLYTRDLARRVVGVPDFLERDGLVPVTTNGTTRWVPPKEPLFLLRAQDPCAAQAVRYWGELARARGADQDIVIGAHIQASAMDAWPVKKRVPDLPKGQS